MAANAGAIVTRIQNWVIDSDLTDAELWALMDEVIDDILEKSNPWFCYNFGQSARTAANHMNDSDLIPPAYEDEVLAVDANIVSGATVPDNSDYLNALLFPTGLIRPIKVYYGPSWDNVELDYIGWEEFMYVYPPHNSGPSGTSDPVNWTDYNGTILIAPTPPLTTTISVYGIYRPAEISASGDSNVFTSYAANLLRYGVMRKLIIYNFEEDGGRFPLIDKKYRDAKNGLITRTKYQAGRAHRARSRRAGTRRTAAGRTNVVE